MNRWGPLLLALGACGRSIDFAGPAPAGALQCSLEHALAAGYELVEGSVEGRFLRLAQRLPPAPAEEHPAQPDPELGDAVLRAAAQRPVENQILVAEERGRLTFRVLGLNDAGVRVGPGSNAEDQARTMLALCTSPPPASADVGRRQAGPGQLGR